MQIHTKWWIFLSLFPRDIAVVLVGVLHLYIGIIVSHIIAHAHVHVIWHWCVGMVLVYTHHSSCHSVYSQC